MVSDGDYTPKNAKEIAANAQSTSTAGPYAYVTNSWDHTVSIIDTATDTATSTVVATVNVGYGPVAFGQSIGPLPAPEPVHPVANFSSNSTRGNAPLEVQFTDKSTGSLVSRLWTFQDGTASAEQNPKHTFTIPAGYHVVLTVKDSYGKSFSKGMTLFSIEAPAPYQPKAKLVATPTSGEAPLSVNFISDVSGNATYYAWTFERSIQQITPDESAKHVYIKEGTYYVTLVVKNTAGETDRMTKKGFVTVLPK